MCDRVQPKEKPSLSLYECASHQTVAQLFNEKFAISKVDRDATYHHYYKSFFLFHISPAFSNMVGMRMLLMVAMVAALVALLLHLVIIIVVVVELVFVYLLSLETIIFIGHVNSP